jgi:hypothetical protein
MVSSSHGITSAVEAWLLIADPGKLEHDGFRRSCHSRSCNLRVKQRDIYTPEVREALDFLQPRIRPDWLIQHFRYHAQLNDVDVDKQAQQQALRAIFPSIRESVKDLL